MEAKKEDNQPDGKKDAPSSAPFKDSSSKPKEKEAHTHSHKHASKHGKHSAHHGHKRKHESRHRSPSSSSSGSSSESRSRSRDRKKRGHSPSSSGSSSRSSSRTSKHKPKSQTKQPTNRRTKHKYRFDSPPKATDMPISNTIGNPVAAAAGLLLNNDSQASTAAATALAQKAKVEKKLYIGNLPPGLNSPTLLDLLNAALIRLRAVAQEGNPATNAWISADGRYAFVEFRSPEEAAKASVLNNISIMGQPLMVAQPKMYTGSFGGLNPLVASGLNLTSALQLNNPTLSPENAFLIGPEPGMVPDHKSKVQFPTRILTLKNIADPSDLLADEDYYELQDDVRDECAKYGMLSSIEIPRPRDDEDRRPFIGRIFVEFATVEDAKEARCQLSGRKFGGRVVEVNYYPEDLFYKRDFSAISP